MEPTPKPDMDAAIAELRRNMDRWAQLGVPARIELLRAAIECTFEGAEDQVRDACKAKGLDFDAPVAAEEWLGGPYTILRNMRLLVESLQDIDTFGRPKLKEGAVRTRPGGQLAVEVFPQNFLDKLMFAKFRAEVWMDPELTDSELGGTMARIYRESGNGSAQNGDGERTGKVALVLGAGNVASIGPMDVLYKLFVENQVCVLKMNPVNEYLGPHIERAFQPFVDEGFLRVAYGGAEEGDYLVHHDGVDEIHITGSDVVHDIIVWGKPGAEQDKNREAGTPKLDKHISSELGNVTPIIVVPGDWSDREMDFTAANVATMMANNASFNCNAGKLLITWEKWPQREAFLERLERTLASINTRTAYYPGSEKKYDAFLTAHPDAKLIGERTDAVLPWTLILDVDESDTDDIVFTREPWCAILSETRLEGSDAGDYLKQAVRFCNEHVWGTLACSVMVDPRTQQKLGPALEQAVADLRYGSVAVNHWAAIVYGLGQTTWGAYPGHTLEKIVSGIGVVHNTLMFERAQKSVVWGPFVVKPKPPWFSTHRNSHTVARRLTAFEYKPSFWKFLGVATAAMGG